AGEVSNSGVQAGAEKIAEKYAPDAIISRLTVVNSQQVILEVRILEASRSALQDLGINFAAGNSNVQASASPIKQIVRGPNVISGTVATGEVPPGCPLSQESDR
ncbi:MAG: hypothetical protein EBR23_04425, partial [Planctomycetia bacterium]|nr:hypothetical protein [Planctomycetia bacterium]